MAASKAWEMLRRDLNGETILWQGDCMMLYINAKAQAGVLTAVTTTGLHVFRKAIMTIKHEAFAAEWLSDVMSEGVATQTSTGSVGAVIFKIRDVAVLLTPLTGEPTPLPSLVRR